MPKRKEVHLKKLIKGGDEPHKQEDIQVRCFLYKSNRRNQKPSLSYHTGTRTWHLESLQMISHFRFKECRKLLWNVYQINCSLTSDIHLFFKDGQPSYYPIVQNLWWFFDVRFSQTTFGFWRIICKKSTRQRNPFLYILKSILLLYLTICWWCLTIGMEVSNFDVYGRFI